MTAWEMPGLREWKGKKNERRNRKRGRTKETKKGRKKEGKRKDDVFAWEMPGKGEKKKQMMGITHYFSRFTDGYGFVLWEGKENGGRNRERGRTKEIKKEREKEGKKERGKEKR